MASTGEVACLGDDFDEAFLKALLAVGYHLQIHTVLLSTGPVESKAAFLASARILADLGAHLYATQATEPLTDAVRSAMQPRSSRRPGAWA